MLRLGKLLDDLLNDNTIIDSSIAGIDFNVKVAAIDGDIDLLT